MGKVQTAADIAARVHHWIDEAERLLAPHRAAVVDLACELIDRGELAGEAITFIMLEHQ